jgi:hypothetical protein
MKITRNYHPKPMTKTDCAVGYLEQLAREKFTVELNGVELLLMREPGRWLEKGCDSNPLQRVVGEFNEHAYSAVLGVIADADLNVTLDGPALSEVVSEIVLRNATGDNKIVAANRPPLLDTDDRCIWDTLLKAL